MNRRPPPTPPAEVLRALRTAGCEVSDTKSGTRVALPSGQYLYTHCLRGHAGDAFALVNFLRDVRKAGLTL